jgi:hypothetical protein
MTGSAPVVHLELPRPALLKPRQLWTGKQLLSAVVSHFSAGRPPLTFSSSSKVELCGVAVIECFHATCLCGRPSMMLWLCVTELRYDVA